MATATAEVETVLTRMKAGRDHWKAESRQRYLRNPSLTPAELYDAPTDAELRAKAEIEVAARAAYRATKAGEFIGSIGRGEALLLEAGAALSMVRSARDRADGEVSDDVLAKLAEFKAAIAQLQAEAILMGVFAAEAQADALRAALAKGEA